MITSSLFADPGTGQRLGNQLFQLAALLGLAIRYDTQLLLPDRWRYKHVFRLHPRIVWGSAGADKVLSEPGFACHLDFFDAHTDEIRSQCVDIRGFLQSEKYWKAAEHEVKNALAFRLEINDAVQGIIEQSGIDDDITTAISVRRGDFRTDANHVLLPASYYEKAYRHHFSGSPICFFSDDCKWCERHLTHLCTEAFSAGALSPVLQLACMSRFHHFVIANSTFSWWEAYLAEGKDKVVIRPARHFSGALAATDIADHYPTSWHIEK